MVIVRSLNDYKYINDFALFLGEESPKLIIKKFDNPIVIDLEELDLFINEFLIKDELIHWICDNVLEIQKYPDILKLIMFKISTSRTVSECYFGDGTKKYEINGEKHKIEILQDEFGSLVQIKDKKERVLIRASVYEKKTITTTVRNEEDDTDIVVLYPKTKQKTVLKTNDIKHWKGDRNANTNIQK